MLSFLELGHEVTLYVTGPVRGVPPGVIVRDAAEVFKTESILRYRKNGSPALHSNLFRYALLRSTESMWVDLDVICLKPMRFTTEYIFGLETPDVANGAVLKLPNHSLALTDLLTYHEKSVGYPPHLNGIQKIKYFLKSKGRGLPITEWPWGSTGPRGLTFHLKQHNEFRHALPTEAFYPIPLDQTHLFIEPGRLTRADFTDASYAVHLWAKQLRLAISQTPNRNLHPDSFLGREIARQSEWSGFSIEMRS